jgi:hypothetical protein
VWLKPTEMLSIWHPATATCIGLPLQGDFWFLIKPAS